MASAAPADAVPPPSPDAPGAATDAAPPPPPPPASDLPPCQRTVDVAAPAALASALAAAMPGDCLRVADGAYGALTVSARATAAAPIQVRAANRLKASVSALQFSNAAHVVVEGFAISTILFVNSTQCRVTRCQVRGPGSGYWIRIEEQKGCMSGCSNTPPGTSDGSRVDHCDIGGGSSSSDIFNPTALSTNTRIDHNYIHDVSGPHLMTIGCCGAKYDYHESGTVVEYNLFANARGTSAELISIKSSNATFRYNTVGAHNGDVDIRAGRRNSIHGNYIFAPGGGIRMYEDDHKIYNNYVETGTALRLGPPGPIHAPVRNAVVVFNTFVGGVSLSGTGNVIANNLIVGGGGAPGGMGNLSGSAAELGLSRMDRVLSPTAASRAAGAATGSFPFVTEDIAGRPRPAKPDVGAEQISTMPALRRVLTPADVGPMAP